MQVSQSPLSDDLTDVEADRVELFREHFWRSSEICNNCFERIRDVGPRITIALEEPTEKIFADGGQVMMETNEWYERTENASQEHTSFDDNRRFGICFCKACGTDCTADHRHKTLTELKPLAKNIARYTRKHLDLDLQPRAFAQELARLKRVPEYQGFETEMLAVAYARSIST